MLDDGEKLVPGFRQARALRVWTGVRPLFEDAKASDTDTRDVTRAHALLDHARARRRRRLRDDHRRQADDLPADGRGDRRRGLRATSARRGRARPRPSRCRAPRTAQNYHARRAAGSARRRSCRRAGDLRVRAGRRARSSSEAISAAPADQPRRHPPAAAPRDGAVPGRLLHLPRDRHPARARRAHGRAGRPTRCCDFLQERWKGVWPVLYGDQLRQVALRRLDVPGRARRGASASDARREPVPRVRERAALRRGRDRRRHGRPDRRRRGWRRAVRRSCVLAKGVGSTHLVARRRSTCSATRPSASRRRARRWRA